jgi:hypothetical protein
VIALRGTGRRGSNPYRSRPIIKGARFEEIVPLMAVIAVLIRFELHSLKLYQVMLSDPVTLCELLGYDNEYHYGDALAKERAAWFEINEVIEESWSGGLERYKPNARPTEAFLTGPIQFLELRNGGHRGHVRITDDFTEPPSNCRCRGFCE